MAKISYQNLYDGLSTLESPDGVVPETRMKEASQVREMVSRGISRDQTERDWKRSRLKGMVDGNPPYVHANLVAAGRGDECNVNWRIAKYFFGLAKGMVYDVLTEETTLATVTLDYYKVRDLVRNGNNVAAASADQVTEASHIVTEEFDLLQKSDENHDFTTQQSIGQMVLFGPGPQIFDDEFDWRTESIEAKCLIVPEFAKANTNKWEWAALVMEYSPDRLYARIQHPDAATKSGWNVPYTRRCIMNAHPLTSTGTMYQNWSFHQDLLKNGSFYYADQSKFIRVAHFFFREFPKDGDDEGRITHCIIDLDGESSASDGTVEYLYQSVGRYKSWSECIHPMLWDDDPNGCYHSVTGLGIEMYMALEYENRLLCRLADDAFAPKLFFKPTTASEREKMSISHVGRYGILPAALDMVQQHVQPMLQDGIAMHREITGLVSSNLSQFRSNALTKQQGNPVTARQIDYEASEQAKMGKTQLARIYEQYDWLYAEKYRRATNSQLTKAVRGGRAALEFIDRCKKRAVPQEWLQAVQSVRSTRVVGQGSSFMRQQALEFLLGMVGMLPEGGRASLIKQVIASRAGQCKVQEFYPENERDNSVAQQQADAMSQVAGMKVGVPPVPVPTQNPMIFASTFIAAMEAAQQAVQQGGDPAEAVAFIDLALPAAAHHLANMAQDKTRADAVKQLGQRLKAIEQFAEQVKAALQQQQQEQQSAQAELQRTQMGMDPETQVGMAKVQASHAVKMFKTQGDLELKARKQQADMAMSAHRQMGEMAMADAETAHGLRMDAAVAGAKVAAAKAKPVNGAPK